ncbi:hypothetical protein ACJIZ3_025334 [Penstemon smallii]|uniref:Uncharacterized protein n=1 Tax=Penstemon smallii TaxID=265156 RepID=A0ABD3TWJ2_9LAMI
MYPHQRVVQPTMPPPIFHPPLHGENYSAPILYIKQTPVGIEQQDQKIETDWNSTLFDCHSDFNVCCKTTICPWITSSEIAEIVYEGKTSKREAMIIIGFCSCCMWMYTCYNRTTIRSKFNIKGSPSLDCVTHAFCLPCALCQEYRELDHRGFDPSLGWFENLERQRNAVAIYTVTPPQHETMTR